MVADGTSAPPVAPTSPSTSVPPARGLELALILGIVAWVSAAAMGPVLDEDIWFHIAFGRWMVEHRALPSVDVFAQPGTVPWTSYGPLWDISLFLLHRAWGLVGIEVLRWASSLAVALALCALLVRRAAQSPWGAAIAAGVLGATQPSLQERSWIISILGTVLALIAVDRLRDGRKGPLLWLAPLFTVWANIHVQVVLGVAILWLAAAEDEVLRRLGSRLRLARSTHTAGPLTLWAALIGTAATLVHPLGWRLFALALTFRAPHKMQNWILELHRPDFTEVSDWWVLALGIAGVAGVVVTALRTDDGTRRVLLLELGLILLGFQRFLHYRRDRWVLAIAGAAALASAISGWHFEARGIAARLNAALSRRWLMGTLVAALLAFVVLEVAGWPESYLEELVRAHFPVGAVEEVERLQLPGPLFNDFNWGGYLMFALPRLPVATDGRMDVRSEDDLERNILTWVGRANDPALDRANLVISERFHGLPDRLAHDPAWRQVYADDISLVFARRIPIP